MHCKVQKCEDCGSFANRFRDVAKSKGAGAMVQNFSIKCSGRPSTDQALSNVYVNTVSVI